MVGKATGATIPENFLSLNCVLIADYSILSSPQKNVLLISV